MHDFRKRLQDEDSRRAFERFEARCGRFGERERRTMPVVVEEVRDSGAGVGQFTVKGHGAVFNRKSLDLGGFQEVIAPGAFRTPSTAPRTSICCGTTTRGSRWRGR
jgi:hypothetical protein